MGIIDRIGSFLLRNVAFSDAYVARMGTARFKTWTVSKAVKDGYTASGWVYRAVKIITDAASSVPWKVIGKDGEFVDGHPITNLLKYPNPYISSKMFFKLLIMWMELTGNAYSYKTKVGRSTKELWPISPDRIAPVPSKTIDEWIAGYCLDQKGGIKYQPQEIMHFKFMDPADPLVGIAPLEAARRAVDVDVDQQKWNMAAMQNRGVMDGIFTFEKNFKDFKEADNIAERLNERYSGTKNARKLGVLGGKAKYQRLGLNALELDYMNSRRFNREEIFIIFGIPPQYAGAMERSTYNNYTTSELILWFGTLIPLLDDIADTMTFSFRDELKEGEKITTDISRIPAIRTAMAEKSKTAKILHAMGVPFEQINRVFEFGFEEFEGWEKSLVNIAKMSNIEEVDDSRDPTGAKKTFAEEDQRSLIQIFTSPGDVRAIAGGFKSLPIDATDSMRSKNKNNGKANYTLVEKRSLEDELKLRETLAAEEIAPKILKVFEATRDQLVEEIAAKGIDISKTVVSVIASNSKALEDIMEEVYLTYGMEFGKDVVLQRAEIGDSLEDLLRSFLDEEQTLLTEVSMINETSSSLILDLVEDATQTGMSVESLQQAIMDVGIFSEGRALTIGRTTMGTAQSIGQFHAAFLTGATHKRWETAVFEVRDEHAERRGEEIPISETFSPKFGMAIGPRWPLDNRLVAADRINCRCSMSFSIK